MMTESGVLYRFAIMNTDRSDKNGIYQWSFLDLHPKEEISLFNSFGFEGFKEFVLQNGQKVLKKTLYDRLSETAIDLLHLINKYGKKYDLKDVIIVYLVDNQLQMIERDTC